MSFLIAVMQKKKKYYLNLFIFFDIMIAFVLLIFNLYLHLNILMFFIVIHLKTYCNTEILQYY